MLKTSAHKCQYLQGIDYAAPIYWRHKLAQRGNTIAAERQRTSNSHQRTQDL